MNKNYSVTVAAYYSHCASQCILRKALWDDELVQQVSQREDVMQEMFPLLVRYNNRYSYAGWRRADLNF